MKPAFPLLAALLLAPFSSLHSADADAPKLNVLPRNAGQPAEIAVGATADEFSVALIPPISVASEEHFSTVKDGVAMDVYYDHGPKSGVGIYTINTGRKQLVLTPEKHRAILENLIRKKLTVVVADFRDKKLPGLELEKYVPALTAAVREAADAVFHPAVPNRQPPANGKPTVSKTETYANDYFVLMPGFTVDRAVTWFRYGDIPEPFRRAIAGQLGQPFREADAEIANTYDIIYPAYGPDVGVLTNYGSNEKSREDYCAQKNTFLVMAFALKNLAIVHQQYFNDPAGGYPKGYSYYGDQFAVNFIRHLKGNAARYHLDVRKICCFGHSKGSEIPGMLVNRLRGAAPYFHAKADFKKLSLMENDEIIPSPFSNLPTDITCAIFGAGVANHELLSDKMQPWNNSPTMNMSPFFIYADHRPDTRLATREAVAKAEANGVAVETAELEAHTWPIGDAYDRASAFADRMLDLHY